MNVPRKHTIATNMLSVTILMVHSTVLVRRVTQEMERVVMVSLPYFHTVLAYTCLLYHSMNTADSWNFGSVRFPYACRYEWIWEIQRQHQYKDVLINNSIFTWGQTRLQVVYPIASYRVFQKRLPFQVGHGTTTSIQTTYCNSLRLIIAFERPTRNNTRFHEQDLEINRSFLSYTTAFFEIEYNKLLELTC